MGFKFLHSFLFIDLLLIYFNLSHFHKQYNKTWSALQANLRELWDAMWRVQNKTKQNKNIFYYYLALVIKKQINQTSKQTKQNKQTTPPSKKQSETNKQRKKQ